LEERQMRDRVRYDERTAVVVVDLQNDFAQPEGSLYVRGGEEIVGAANLEVERALAAGAFVVYTQDWHPPDTPHFAPYGGKWPVHCVHDTWGAEFPPGLVVVGPQVHKARGHEDGYSGFTVEHVRTGARFSTDLETLLRAREITKLVIVGLATDYCVKETGLDGIRLGFRVTVLRDAVRAVDVEPGDGERALDELAAAGVMVV
jgi:nicotinamidase/pyrazinamidase